MGIEPAVVGVAALTGGAFLDHSVGPRFAHRIRRLPNTTVSVANSSQIDSSSSGRTPEKPQGVDEKVISLTRSTVFSADEY
jgi:hypothetical protein